jgi:hypothetical protein
MGHCRLKACSNSYFYTYVSAGKDGKVARDEENASRSHGPSKRE